MLEDKILISRFKAGSADALAGIYKKYKNSLLKLAVALLNDNSAAEDVVHNVFVNFAQSADSIKTAGSLKSFLATCVANRAKNRLKAMHQRKSYYLKQAHLIDAKSKRPEQWILQNEKLEKLNNALAQIPYDQREVISLHLHTGMKFREIAELQNISINTTQSRYRYGLEKLRILLDSEVMTE